MSVRLAAAAAALCTLFGGRLAHAEDPAPTDPGARPRRPVAVIELSDSAPGRDLTDQLLNELNNNRDDLKPLDSITLQTELRAAIADENVESIEDARKLGQVAETAVSNYKFDDAANNASAGQTKLQFAAPTPAVTTLYAELSFVLGTALLGQRQPDRAQAEFRLAHAVDPAFKPDGIRYLPEVVQAYEAAIKITPRMAQIGVNGSGRVFIDGHDMTTVLTGTRQSFDVPAGTHVVWLTGPDREPRATTVTVAANRKEEIAIDPASLDDTKRVRRFKLALKLAPDPAARASAIQDLTSFLHVGDAVLLTSVNGKIVVQTWRDRAPGFSALREYRDGDKPAEVLAPLLPPKKIAVIPKPLDCVGHPEDPGCPPKPLTIDTRAWYRKPRYQIAGGAGLAFVLGVVAYELATWNRTVGVNTDLGQTRK